MFHRTSEKLTGRETETPTNEHIYKSLYINSQKKVTMSNDVFLVVNISSTVLLFNFVFLGGPTFVERSLDGEKL